MEWSSGTKSSVLASFFYGYLVAQIPGGLLADRWSSFIMMSFKCNWAEKLIAQITVATTVVATTSTTTLTTFKLYPDWFQERIRARFTLATNACFIIKLNENVHVNTNMVQFCFCRYGGKRVLLIVIIISSILTVLMPLCARTSIYLVYANRVTLGFLNVRISSNYWPYFSKCTYNIEQLILL